LDEIVITKEYGNEKKHWYLDGSFNCKFYRFKFRKNSFSILSKFTFTANEEALCRSETLMHNKRKTELHNYLKKDLHFIDKKIDVESADKMTDNEKTSFVKNHFKK